MISYILSSFNACLQAPQLFTGKTVLREGAIAMLWQKFMFNVCDPDGNVVEAGAITLEVLEIGENFIRARMDLEGDWTTTGFEWDQGERTASRFFKAVWHWHTAGTLSIDDSEWTEIILTYRSSRTKGMLDRLVDLIRTYSIEANRSAELCLRDRHFFERENEDPPDFSYVCYHKA